MLIVLRDPLEPHPHDPDVKTLLRVAVVCSIPLACNRATADLVIPPPLCLKLAAGFSALQAGVLRDRDSCAPWPAPQGRRDISVLGAGGRRAGCGR